MKISTSDECYRHFLKMKGLDGDGDPDLVGLFAYALVERDRIDWIDHRETHGFGEPTAIEIQAWYGQKPQSYFDEKLKQADSRFDLYARGYLAEDIENERKVAAKQAVVDLRTDMGTNHTAVLTAVGNVKDPSGHWWRSATQGMLGNFMFAAIVVFVIWVSSHNTDLVAWARERLGLTN